MDAYETGYGDDLQLLNLRDLFESDSDSEDEEEDLQNLMVNCAVYKDHPMCAGFAEVDLQNLSMFSKMGKGLKKFEEKAKKARDVGKKYYPMADQAFAIVAPQNHAKYAPKLEKGYKTFNANTKQMDHRR